MRLDLGRRLIWYVWVAGWGKGEVSPKAWRCLGCGFWGNLGDYGGRWGGYLPHKAHDSHNQVVFAWMYGMDRVFAVWHFWIPAFAGMTG